MERVLLITLFFVAIAPVYANFDFVNTCELTFINDKTFSFELESTATEQSITILSGIKEPMLVKVIDKSGFIRIQKKLHLDRQIDLSLLREGLYLVKVYVGNHIEVKRFFKGPDGVDVR